MGIWISPLANSKEDSIQTKAVYMNETQLHLESNLSFGKFIWLWKILEKKIQYNPCMWDLLCLEEAVSVLVLNVSKLFCMTEANGPPNSVSQGFLYVLVKLLCVTKMIKGPSMRDVCVPPHHPLCANKYASAYASIVTQKVKSWQASWRPHLPHVTLVCQNNLCWQTWYDILSVLGYSVHESSIITSLMALEWGQSLMTWCFMALLEIFALTWEGCRYFL